MATYAARRLTEMTQNAAVVVGIEAMAAAQGLEFHRPLRSSAPVEQEFLRIRALVEYLDQDRYLAEDIERMKQWASSAYWPAHVETLMPKLSSRAKHAALSGR